ncbi:MAG TPA: hypothetical protein PKA58_37565 [Polyangium sp.]|nr:hypothetical protein [Polyangium sp.]
MPNFTARIVTGSQAPWIDASTNDAPSRQNNDPEFLSSYRKIDTIAGDVVVEARATVGGVEAPLDGALGGELFVAVWAEWSGLYPPAIVHASGQTSVMTFTVTQGHVGHFCLRIRRPNGGIVFLHFDVEDSGF